MTNLTSKAQAREMAELTCRLSRACSKKETSFAALFQLTPTELRCLRMFSKKSTVSIKEMIDELEISAGRVTHILTSLEQKNYITRRVDKSDKRNHLVDLTPESRKFINLLTKKHIELHQNILNNISDDKKTFVSQIMKELIDALENWSEVNKAKLQK
ncbi:MAG: MarR family transcriptional regulator [Ignavibacteriae bacterium]|nr:MarR family transcriptional regulator [Ignavibacteriota bacterium]MCB9210543.1 MarR family transcriptional regulator [Ignavibacteriales bacterium]MCB9257749.1 MarR family transcriptional regulator [Ignavibacteriales bacterium]